MNDANYLGKVRRWGVFAYALYGKYNVDTVSSGLYKRRGNALRERDRLQEGTIGTHYVVRPVWIPEVKK